MPPLIFECFSLIRISLKIKSSTPQGVWKYSILRKVMLRWGRSRLTELPTGQLMMCFMGWCRCWWVWDGVQRSIRQLAWLINNLCMCSRLWIIKSLINCGLSWSPQIWDEISWCLFLCFNILDILAQVFHVFHVKCSISFITPYGSHAALQKFISEDLIISDRASYGLNEVFSMNHVDYIIQIINDFP